MSAPAHRPAPTDQFRDATKMVGARPYTQATVFGRILIALRAGDMSRDALCERFGDCNTQVSRLVAEGLLEIRPQSSPNILRLTAAGRAACPNRRDPVEPSHSRKPRRRSTTA